MIAGRDRVTSEPSPLRILTRNSSRSLLGPALPRSTAPASVMTGKRRRPFAGRERIPERASRAGDPLAVPPSPQSRNSTASIIVTGAATPPLTVRLYSHCRRASVAVGSGTDWSTRVSETRPLPPMVISSKTMPCNTGGERRRGIDRIAASELRRQRAAGHHPHGDRRTPASGGGLGARGGAGAVARVRRVTTRPGGDSPCRCGGSRPGPPRRGSDEVDVDRTPAHIGGTEEVDLEPVAAAIEQPELLVACDPCDDRGTS